MLIAEGFLNLKMSNALGVNVAIARNLSVSNAPIIGLCLKSPYISAVMLRH